MAASPSPPPQDRAEPPTMPPPPPALPSSSASRRLPPPCWSNDETTALIDSYREKWYSLRRGNLKATHWQEVADAVVARCPAVPVKTSVQCRHKMEKLRKRYRAELQRFHSAAGAHNRHRTPSSSWVHFHRMHSMEKGPNTAAVDPGSRGSDGKDDNEDEDEDDEDEDEDDEDEALYANGVKPHGVPYNRRVHPVTSNGIARISSRRSAFRIKFPGAPSSMAPPGTAGFRQRNHENPNPNFGFGASRDSPGPGKKRGERSGDAMGEMVEAVKMLGDGFVRMEKMKMEMAREIEEMRMDMEMKRTQMILDSQQRIVEAFAEGLAEKKKKRAKRLPSPDS